jgi:hypothetical protein
MNGAVIAIILDPAYVSDLNRLACQDPVWIVDTPANRGLVERERTAGQDVTTFMVEDPDDRFGNFLGIVDAVELHHGPYSQAPPYRSMLIVGAQGDDWAEL